MALSSFGYAVAPFEQVIRRPGSAARPDTIPRAVTGWVRADRDGCTNPGFVTVRTVPTGCYQRPKLKNRAVVLAMLEAWCSCRSVTWCFDGFCSLPLCAFGRPILRTGNRRPSARTGHPAARNPPSGDDLDRQAFPGGGQSALAARTLAVLHHHTGDAASLTWPSHSGRSS